MECRTTGKSSRGKFLEDFRIGQTLSHAHPRTLTRGDQALYNGIFGDRHTLYNSDEFARRCGLTACPVHDLLVFHTVFGKSVGDLSLNAIANLGYAEASFPAMVRFGDTLRAESAIIGIKQNSSGRNGIIWVRTRGYDQADRVIIDYKRWVMVNKRDVESPPPPTTIPVTADMVDAGHLPLPGCIDFSEYDFSATGEPWRLGDYTNGETIDHIDATTLTDTEHMLATRVFHNTARVHFDVTTRSDNRRLIYGGHLISLARAMSCNGLANAQVLLAINSGSHVNPCFAGDTVTASSEVIERADHPAPGAGAIRLRTRLRKVLPESNTRDKEDDLLLDLDYWCLMPV